MEVQTIGELRMLHGCHERRISHVGRKFDGENDMVEAIVGRHVLSHRAALGIDDNVIRIQAVALPLPSMWPSAFYSASASLKALVFGEGRFVLFVIESLFVFGVQRSPLYLIFRIMGKLFLSCRVPFDDNIGEIRMQISMWFWKTSNTLTFRPTTPGQGVHVLFHSPSLTR